jgi:predicted RNA binding protein YcfA (HicA-like mRNA interferase family)
MASLPSITARELLHMLIRHGFYVHHQAGSHARLLHRTDSSLRVTLPVHNGDLPEPTLRRIIKQAGLTDDQFLELLRT